MPDFPKVRLDYGAPPGACGRPQVSCEAAGHTGSSQYGVERASYPKLLPINGSN
jgi:hypothetical protein